MKRLKSIIEYIGIILILPAFIPSHFWVSYRWRHHLYGEDAGFFFSQMLYKSVRNIAIAELSIIVIILSLLLVHTNLHYQNFIAVVNPILTTVIVIYINWQILMSSSLNIEMERIRRAKDPMYMATQIHGVVGWPVSLQLIKLTFFLLIGYAVLGLVYSCSYFAVTETNIERTFVENFYFSFITMSTIGYGDIVPSGMSRVIVIIQHFSQFIYQILSLAGAFAIIGKITSEPLHGLGYQAQNNSKN